MAIVENPTFPVEMRCPACGRQWTQWKPEVWPDDEVISCACGEYAEVVTPEAAG